MVIPAVVFVLSLTASKFGDAAVVVLTFLALAAAIVLAWVAHRFQSGPGSR